MMPNSGTKPASGEAIRTPDTELFGTQPVVASRRPGMSKRERSAGSGAGAGGGGHGEGAGTGGGVG
jgi:hypothetical protein